MSTGPGDKEPSEIVEVLLTAAGLGEVPSDEIERLATLYPGLRRSVDRFHDIDVGDDVTAAIFQAAEDHGGGDE